MTDRTSENDSRASLEDFASIPGVPSERTLRKIIKDNPDFPTVKAGRSGVAYEIPVTQALAWLKERAEREEAAKRAHAEDIRQHALDFLGRDAATAVEQQGLSTDERLKLLQEEIAACKVRQMRGELIRKDSVEAALANLLVASRRQGETFAARLSKRVDLPRDVMVQIDALMEQDLKALAADLEAAVEVDDG